MVVVVVVVVENFDTPTVTGRHLAFGCGRGRVVLSTSSQFSRSLAVFVVVWFCHCGDADTKWRTNLKYVNLFFPNWVRTN